MGRSISHCYCVTWENHPSEVFVSIGRRHLFLLHLSLSCLHLLYHRSLSIYRTVIPSFAMEDSPTLNATLEVSYSSIENIPLITLHLQDPYRFNPQNDVLWGPASSMSCQSCGHQHLLSLQYNTTPSPTAGLATTIATATTNGRFCNEYPQTIQPTINETPPNAIVNHGSPFHTLPLNSGNQIPLVPGNNFPTTRTDLNNISHLDSDDDSSEPISELDDIPSSPLTNDFRECGFSPHPPISEFKDELLRLLANQWLNAQNEDRQRANSHPLGKGKDLTIVRPILSYPILEIRHIHPVLF